MVGEELRENRMRKRLVSGLLWIVFSPLVLLMAPIAKGGSETDYYVGVAVCGTWSACGVMSGVGTIAGTRWAMRVQTILCWIAFIAFCLIPAALLLFYAFNTGIGYFVGVAVPMLLTGTLLLIRARRRQRELRADSKLANR